jgi:hypothetical protein
MTTTIKPVRTLCTEVCLTSRLANPSERICAQRELRSLRTGRTGRHPAFESPTTASTIHPGTGVLACVTEREAETFTFGKCFGDPGHDQSDGLHVNRFPAYTFKGVINLLFCNALESLWIEVVFIPTRFGSRGVCSVDRNQMQDAHLRGPILFCKRWRSSPTQPHFE